MATTTYTVTFPVTPGATPTSTECASLREARRIAAAETSSRRDLTRQDVVIRSYRGGAFVRAEYAGPCR